MKSTSDAYILYILSCSDNTYYTGITNNLDKRLSEHNTSDKGAKYTRYRRPVTLLYSEICANKSDALKRELFIKKLSRREKDKLLLK